MVNGEWSMIGVVRKLGTGFFRKALSLGGMLNGQWSMVGVVRKLGTGFFRKALSLGSMVNGELSMVGVVRKLGISFFRMKRVMDKGESAVGNEQQNSDHPLWTINKNLSKAISRKPPFTIHHSPFTIGFTALFILLLASCNSPYVSKKRGYFNIELPKRGYQKFDRPGFPYSFEYPVYARIIQDSTYFDSNPENPYWVNIDFPSFGGRVFLSYKIIGGNAVYKIKQADGKYRDSLAKNDFDKMVNDAFTLTNKNDVVSSSIKDSLIHTPNNVSGVFFKVGGNAATAKQFFLSDTTKNFIRGALYFDVTPNADSLQPVQDFLQADLEHIINSFQWKQQ